MNRSVRPSAWQSPSREVAFFRDPAETWFAADVMRQQGWSDDLLEPLDPEEADIRLAFLRDMPRPQRDRPDWLCLIPETLEEEPRMVVEVAQRAWARCDAFRAPGPAPEAYLVAGFQALCPPHPLCEPGPGMRDSLMEFLAERPGVLGRVARESDDGANRLLRLLWRSPEEFAEEILRSRIRAEGGRSVLQLVEFLEAAEVARDAEEHADLALERDALLARLPALAYFTQPSDFDRAAALALDWRERYHRAYRSHYRAVLSGTHEIVADTSMAASLLPELEAMNRLGSPVGEDAGRRLQAALARLATLPDEVDDHSAQTAGIVLGRMPVAIAEARLASAAVLAALDVHRRRRPGAARAVGHASDDSYRSPR